MLTGTWALQRILPDIMKQRAENGCFDPLFQSGNHKCMKYYGFIFLYKQWKPLITKSLHQTLSWHSHISLAYVSVGIGES